MLKKLLVIICIIILTACSNEGRIQPRGTDDLINETWITQMNTNPNIWLSHADPWFLTGKPSINKYDSVLFKGTDAAGDIEEIIVAGEFRVQITGGQGRNSVCILGNRSEKRNISVNVLNHKLMISQIGRSTGYMKDVVVNINIHKIRSIENSGPGLVIGRQIISKKLNIRANGTGSILLNGKMNIHHVENTGTGTITALGVHSPKMQMRVLGSGHVNMSGRIGVESIVHVGNGVINIIGADSDGLCITADGNGITNVFGYVNLKQVTAQHSSHVYVYWADSEKLNVITKNKAIVGIAGSSASLDVATSHTSCFLGQYLRSGAIYVSTKDRSHADVYADQKIFATASNQSGILYYGPTASLTTFVYHQATIIPIRDVRRNLPNPPFTFYKSNKPI